MISSELEEIFGEAVNEAIQGIPAVCSGLEGLKDYVNNEMDFCLGVLMATIQERYMCKLLDKRKFTKEEVLSTIPYITASIYEKIPKLKEEIKLKLT
ncbi:MAG TPA: hypothetical protein VFK40_00045 [Nitrososphaeraceae archaeon]|jgi:hypothetical protein|nr:hypothetical protein [Nitrososphaeraceae archaeon]HET8792463.1 hypothetical protein [Nitrososphaeraceae archaeon]